MLTWSWLCACHKCAHVMNVRILTLLDVYFGLWCCAWHVGLKLIGGHLLGFGGLRAGSAQWDTRGDSLIEGSSR